jgi:hypothetical protein
MKHSYLLESNWGEGEIRCISDWIELIVMTIDGVSRKGSTN